LPIRAFIDLPMEDGVCLDADLELFHHFHRDPQIRINDQICYFPPYFLSFTVILDFKRNGAQAYRGLHPILSLQR